MQMRPNLPTKNPRITVGLSLQEASTLQDFADRHNHSCSWVGRQAIIEYLERNAGPQGALPLGKKGAANEAA
ncbi:ribbon-helix-helix domain-containing protein [Sphingobium sp. Ant17]|uniref:ribbon-helix-helix domain-containing protein n=1 Tax=Sphingobium sp. Ant17 TaxID=1461752 RepID=UPI001376F83F|nr:ribbon-helix-helix domain-containing protein [Sphingobium sp. Ant17]